jgi:hypothetical protein
MNKPLATPSQRVRSKLLNRGPIRCAVCDSSYIGFRRPARDHGQKKGLIDFVHRGCCEEELGA